MAYFPVFLDLKNKNCLVVGGGPVAFRKVQALLDFDACVTVVAETISDAIKRMDGIVWREEKYQRQHLTNQILVVAATDDKVLNQQIAQQARAENILVNVVNQTQECSFLFSSYLKEGDVVAAFSSGGNAPVVTQYLKEKMSLWVNGQLAQINDFLGKQREFIKTSVKERDRRRIVYEEILEKGLADKLSFSQESVEKILKNIEKK